MGIVNVTVDSFYPASRTPSEADAVDRALQLVEAGADIIDVGGESTRPGAQPVGEEEERERVTPVIRALASEGHVIISVDTMKASVAEAALQAGAEMVNDVTGLGFDPRMAEAVGGSGAAVVINHIRGTPADMQSRTKYCSVVEEVISELRAKIRKGEDAGIGSESMIIDPGIGFAKKAAHNFEILKRLREFGSLGRPVMVGVSRKSFLGFGRELQPRERFEGSLAASVIAAVNGAHIIRTHDVAAVKKAMRIVEQMR
jgi:dihydropteroate synthase